MPGGPPITQTTTYGDYKKVDEGIWLPHSLSIGMGPQSLGMKLDVARVNPSLPDADFKPAKK
jgi:hypothetical protein